METLKYFSLVFFGPATLTYKIANIKWIPTFKTTFGEFWNSQTKTSITFWQFGQKIHFDWNIAQLWQDLTDLNDIKVQNGSDLLHIINPKHPTYIYLETVYSKIVIKVFLVWTDIFVGIHFRFYFALWIVIRLTWRTYLVAKSDWKILFLLIGEVSNLVYVKIKLFLRLAYSSIILEYRCNYLIRLLL